MNGSHPTPSPLRSARGGVFRSAVALLAFSSAGGILGWMLLMPGAIALEIESRTGFPVEAEVLALNPFGLGLTGKNIMVGNSGAYGGGEAMLRVEQLQASASLPSLGRGEIWLYDLELHISRAVLVVNENGALNLDAFANRLFVDSETGSPLPFYAEKVRLVIGEVVFVDNSQILPARREIRASLDTERADLDKAEDIFAPLFELARTVGSLPR